MKRRRVEFSDAAAADVDAACAWIAIDSPANAVGWRAGIRRATEKLALFPRSFPVAHEAAALDCEVRLFVDGAYRVLFTIEHDVVTILRVRHGARRRLGEEE